MSQSAQCLWQYLFSIIFIAFFLSMVLYVSFFHFLFLHGLIFKPTYLYYKERGSNVFISFLRSIHVSNFLFLHKLLFKLLYNGIQYLLLFFIGPKSNHWLPLIVTYSLRDAPKCSFFEHYSKGGEGSNPC